MHTGAIETSPLEVKLVDEKSRELLWDGKSVGELWIRELWVTRECYEDERTKESFVGE